MVCAARSNMLPLTEEIARPDYAFYQSVFSVHSLVNDVTPTTDPRASVLRKTGPTVVPLCSLTAATSISAEILDALYA